MAKNLDPQVLEYVGRHIQKAIETVNFDYIGVNTIRIRMFDPGNMPEGTHLVVELNVKETK